MWIVLLLLGCAPEPKDSADWIEVYADAKCEWAVRCGGSLPYDDCVEAVLELVSPPADGCEISSDAVSACSDTTPACSSTVCDYNADTFWYCSAT